MLACIDLASGLTYKVWFLIPRLVSAIRTGVMLIITYRSMFILRLYITQFNIYLLNQLVCYAGWSFGNILCNLVEHIHHVRMSRACSVLC